MSSGTPARSTRSKGAAPLSGLEEITSPVQKSTKKTARSASKAAVSRSKSRSPSVKAASTKSRSPSKSPSRSTTRKVGRPAKSVTAVGTPSSTSKRGRSQSRAAAAVTKTASPSPPPPKVSTPATRKRSSKRISAAATSAADSDDSAPLVKSSSPTRSSPGRKGSVSATSSVSPLKILLLFILFLAALGLQYWIYITLPKSKKPVPDNIFEKFPPKSIKETRDVGLFLEDYMQDYYWSILSLFTSFYIFLQTFIVPGCIFLNILGSILFGPWVTLFVVCIGSGIGASLCYLMSRWLGGAVLAPNGLIGSRLEPLKKRLIPLIGPNAFFYLLFLRATPIVPNWCLNLACPHLGLDLKTFFWATFFGVGPLSFIHVQIGQALKTTLNLVDKDPMTLLLTWENAVIISVTATLSLLPILVPHSK